MRSKELSIELREPVPLGSDLGSVTPPPVLTLTISGENGKLAQDQCLGATSHYTAIDTPSSWFAYRVTDRPLVWTLAGNH